MSISKFIAVLILFLFCKTLVAQGDSHQNFLEPELEASLLQKTTAKDSLFLWQEQIELQLDKISIAPKDHIFFKAYVLTGPNQVRQSLGDVLKVELLDGSGKLVKSQYHKIIDGVSTGSIEVPKKTQSGSYYLRAYTRWMMNYGPNRFALKTIEVGDIDKAINVLEEEEIQFYPEGGEFVAGLQNKMTVKGTKGLLSNGKIVDGNGNIVSSVTTYTDGLALSTFRPEKGNAYFLVDEEGRKFPLPTPKDEGITLLTNNIDAINAQVRIEVSPELRNEKLNLKGMAKGITYFESELDFKSKPVVELEIPKAGIPKGILNLRVIDEFDQVWAERPIHVQNDELKITIEPVDGNLLKVKVTDKEDRPVETALSLGVNRFNDMDHKKGLTDSGAAGNNFRGQRFVKDLLLMTGQSIDGQRETIDFELPSEIYYDFQKGLDFHGQAYDLDNNLLTNTKIQIFLSTDDDNAMAVEASTNSDGMFKLSGIQFEGEVGMVFRTKGDEAKEQMVKVVPYDYEVPPIDENVSKNQSLKSINKPNNRPNRAISPNTQMNSSDRLIVLEGVTLTEDKTIKTYSQPSVYGIEPTRVVYQDPERPRTIPQLFLGVPGVRVTGLDDLNPRISLPRSAGMGPVLWVIDGFPLSQRPIGPTMMGDVMSMIPFTDVERIEILLGPAAAIYGTRAAAGAILVYTRSGNFDDYFNRKEAQLIYQGFHKSIDFETYLDGLSSKERENSNVVYWNPSLKTDENGEALVKFDTQQSLDKLKIEATAITPAGQIGKTTKYLESQ